MKAFNRRRGRMRRRQKVGWITDYFDFGLDVASAPPKVMTQASICEYDDLRPNTTLVAPPTIVKRVVVSGHFALQLTVTGVATVYQSPSFGWALFVLDVDDTTDADFTDPSFGTLLHAQRILQVGTVGFTFPMMSAFTGTSPTMMVAPRLDIDWRGICKLRPDQQLWVGAQMLAPSGDLSDALIVRVRFLSRVLVASP